jgi:hypothetical protein
VDTFVSVMLIAGLAAWSTLPRSTGARGYARFAAVVAGILVAVLVVTMVITLPLLQSDADLMDAARAQATILLLEPAAEVLGIMGTIAVLASLRAAAAAVGEDELASRATWLWMWTLILGFAVSCLRAWMIADPRAVGRAFAIFAVMIVVFSVAVCAAFLGLLGDTRRALRARLA